MRPEWFQNRTVSVIGLAKGTGKTTALNALLKYLYEAGDIKTPALSSAGYDGEVCGSDKTSASPEILLRSGTLVATAAGLLPACDFSAEVLAATGTPSALGEIYIFRAHSAGKAVLGGPSSVGGLSALKQQFFALGADCVLIDGAVGRRSVGAADVSDAVVLCTAPWMEMTQTQSLETAITAAKLYSLPRYNGEEPAVFLKGAVTDRSIAPLLREPKKLSQMLLVAEEPSRLLLSPQAFSALTALAGRLTVQRRPELLTLCVNPVSPQGERIDIQDYSAQLQEQTGLPVWNVLEDGIA